MPYDLEDIHAEPEDFFDDEAYYPDPADYVVLTEEDFV